MKLYRFTGRKELFKQCGLLNIDPIVTSNLTELKKEVTKIIRRWNKEDWLYNVRVETLTIKSITQATVIEVLVSGDCEHLVEKRATLKEYKREERSPVVE